MQGIGYSDAYDIVIVFLKVGNRGQTLGRERNPHPVLHELQSADGNLASLPDSLLPLLQDKCHSCSCQACLRVRHTALKCFYGKVNISTMPNTLYVLDPPKSCKCGIYNNIYSFDISA